MEERVSHYSTRRLEALSDGMFGIAMTLLILNVTVDHFADITSSTALFQALMTLDMSIIDFIVSFLLLGTMWSVHVRQSEYVARTDRHLMTINLLRLLAVALMPLTTSLAGAYPDIELARLLLPLNFLLLAGISSWEWRYATKKERGLVSEKLTDVVRRSTKEREKLVLGIGIAVLMLSWFIGQWAFLLFAFIPIFTKLFRRKTTSPQLA